MPNKSIVCDPERCTGCRLCDFICSVVKEKTINMELSRIRTVRIEPKINYSLTCKLCRDPPCVWSCPRKALRVDGNSGIILVDDNLCTGCRWCLEACDYGAIVLHPKEKTVKICDLCGGEPKCIDICSKNALHLMTTEQVSQKNRRKAIRSRF